MGDQLGPEYDRELLVNVLVYHQRTDSSGCGCGWAKLGFSHPEHVVQVFEESVALRLRSAPPPKWDYEYSLWPAEGSWGEAVYQAFRGMPRNQLTFTEAEWGAFRDSLDRRRFTLREVTRTPHHDPEIVQ